MRKPKVDIIEVLPNVILLRFDAPFHLGMSLWRYQEYYESPRFKGKTPSIWEFSEYYATTDGQGSFSYPSDVDGYNFPYMVVPRVHDLVRASTPYDNFIRPILKKLDGKCTYIIGMARDTHYSTLKHEIAHALWFTNRTYKKEANTLLKTVPKTTRRAWDLNLAAEEYHEKVFKDETNAYLST